MTLCEATSSIPLILACDGRLVAENGKQFKSGDYTIDWLGFVYDESGKSDEDAITALLSSVSSGTPIGDAAARLRGTFFLSIHDEIRDRRFSLVDDSGLFSAYRSSRGVSTSFLRLAEEMGISSSAFPMEGIVQLLHLGNIYFGDTLSPQIKKLASDEIVMESKSGVEVLPKPIPKLSDAPDFPNLDVASSALAEAVRSKKVSVDLTGGFDSRMLACLLRHHDVDFEAALAGTPGTQDAILGEQVADALGVPYTYCVYDNSAIVDQLQPLLQRMDGLGGAFLVVHRLLQLNESRKERGVELTFKGSGGELFKDFFWTQDFPFYRSGKTRMNRLSRLRIEFEHPSQGILTEDAYRVFSHSLEARRKLLTERYSMPVNTQSYDNVYFYERVQTWNSRTITSCMDPWLAIHSPLAELRLAQVGFHAPRTKRFYNRLHRETISQASRSASRLLTTDGTSAASSALGQLSDGAGYAKTKGRKLLKKLSQVLLNRTTLEPKEYSPDVDVLRRIAATDLCRDALDALRESNVIRSGVELEDLPKRFQEHAVVAGWTLRQLA